MSPAGDAVMLPRPFRTGTERWSQTALLADLDGNRAAVRATLPELATTFESSFVNCPIV